MRLLDILLGRSAPPKPKPDALFALSTAAITLETSLELKLGGRAGVAFRPAEAAAFQELRSELDGLLRVSAAETGSSCRIEQDSFGYTWAVVEDPHLEDLISTVHMISTTVQEHGYGGLLLAAAFRFEQDGGPAYWVYNYKRGAFYPFVPAASGAQRRDNARELRLKAVMERELPIEPKLEQWYALWDLPV